MFSRIVEGKGVKMRIRMTFLLVCLGMCLVNANSQEIAYPNEIEGFQFSKQDKVKDLVLLISSKEDVMRLFGKDCVNGCEFKEDWDIGFAYVNAGWSTTTSTTLLKPLPEFVGKLASITFRPRRPVLLPESTVFPGGLRCNKGSATRGELRFRSITCADDRRLFYNIYDETSAEGKFQKNELSSISYIMTKEKEESIFALPGAGVAEP
jgi:hypothetical protein